MNTRPDNSKVKGARAHEWWLRGSKKYRAFVREEEGYRPEVAPQKWEAGEVGVNYHGYLSEGGLMGGVLWRICGR